MTKQVQPLRKEISLVLSCQKKKSEKEKIRMLIPGKEEGDDKRRTWNIEHQYCDGGVAETTGGGGGGGPEQITLDLLTAIVGGGGQNFEKGVD